MTTTGPLTPSQIVDHPLASNANDLQAKQLSPIERACQRIADATGAPLALIMCIILQSIWLIVGHVTRLDPFPFVFLLTASNVLQLILIFVIAVAQRQSSQHDELRAETDHNSISRLLYHQQVQEALLLSLTEKLGIDTSELQQSVKALAG